MGSGIADFEAFNLKDMFRGVKDDPWKLLVGAGTPVGTELWDGILGKDTEPFVNLWGGPTEGAFNRADAAGIDTSGSRDSHKIAEGIAQSFAGAYGADALGGAVGLGEGQGSNILSGVQNLGGISGGPGFGAPAGATPQQQDEEERLKQQHAMALLEQALRLQQTKGRSF